MLSKNDRDPGEFPHCPYGRPGGGGPDLGRASKHPPTSAQTPRPPIPPPSSIYLRSLASIPATLRQGGRWGLAWQLILNQLQGPGSPPSWQRGRWVGKRARKHAPRLPNLPANCRGKHAKPRKPAFHAFALQSRRGGARIIARPQRKPWPHDNTAPQNS